MSRMSRMSRTDESLRGCSVFSHTVAEEAVDSRETESKFWNGLEGDRYVAYLNNETLKAIL
jgi:hypothetical protein